MKRAAIDSFMAYAGYAVMANERQYEPQNPNRQTGTLLINRPDEDGEGGGTAAETLQLVDKAVHAADAAAKQQFEKQLSDLATDMASGYQPGSLYPLPQQPPPEFPLMDRPWDDSYDPTRSNG